MCIRDSLRTGFPAGHGALGLLSSDEFMPGVTAFDQALLDASGLRIGLITCADHRAAPHSVEVARAHFDHLGATILDPDVIHGDEHLDVDLVYLGGGSPTELLACLRDNAAWAETLAAWRSGVALAGSSAGAMALCQHCLLYTSPSPRD